MLSQTTVSEALETGVKAFRREASTARRLLCNGHDVQGPPNQARLQADHAIIGKKALEGVIENEICH